MEFWVSEAEKEKEVGRGSPSERKGRKEELREMDR